MVKVTLLASSAAVLLASEALAHSWLQCFWSFKDASALTDPSKRNWEKEGEEGTCVGYPRRFPIGYKLGNGQAASFGREDNAFGMQGFIQKDGDNSPACAPQNGFSVIDHSRPDNWNDAYAPGGAYGYTYGQMAKYKAGERVCFRWPAKNHFDNIGQNSPIDMNIWKDDPNQKVPNQNYVNANRVQKSTVMYKDSCPRPGPARNDGGDSNGAGSDLRACGGCIDLKSDLAPGIYSVQWLWFHPTIRYTTCADIEILAAPSATPSVTPSSQAVPAPTPSPSVSPSTIVYPSTQPPAPANGGNNGNTTDNGRPIVIYSVAWDDRTKSYGVEFTLLPKRQISNWELRFTFPSPQQIVTSSFASTYSQIDRDVAIKGVSANLAIGANGRAVFGINVKHGGDKPKPPTIIVLLDGIQYFASTVTGLDNPNLADAVVETGQTIPTAPFGNFLGTTAGGTTPGSNAASLRVAGVSMAVMVIAAAFLQL